MKYLILGAGPAGLSFANRLLDNEINDFLVIEKESESGGLCRSALVDEAALDIGGGHFLDTRRQNINDFLFRFMPEEEWNKYNRDSQICVRDQYIHHPFEANIWEFDIDCQIEYLKSVAAAGCNTGEEMPEEFVSWITWKLGSRIAEDYMIPYNQKMFGDNLNELGTYWLEKLPDVSFEDTLRSCLEHRAFGKQPGHATFYYPKKYGYGELWLRMGRRLGDKLICGTRVYEIDFKEHKVRTIDGHEYIADIIISTIPWKSITVLRHMPEHLVNGIKSLKHTSVRVEYYSENIETKAHWIYYPDKSVDYHRVLVRHNFCSGSRGYWTETNEERYRETGRINSFLNEYAYPLNTLDKPHVMNELLKYCEEFGVYGLGRWGEHEHYNSDVTVERALKLAERLVDY